MTDIVKALTFARECLQWQEGEQSRMVNMSDPLPHLEEFLGKRFFIQIARGTTSLFKWQVIVGLQDRAGTPATTFDHGCAEGDDMWDAVFDACVAAVRLYPA